MNASPVDWQSQSVEGLTRLSVDAMPAMELIYLDGLAVHLLGPDAPAAPYTIEHGTAVASLWPACMDTGPGSHHGGPLLD